MLLTELLLLCASLAAAAAAAAGPTTVALAPLPACHKPLRLCYQGAPADIQRVQTADPLACKPPTDARLVPSCAAVGFSHYVSNDPVFKAVGLWSKPVARNESMEVCSGKCSGDCKVYRPPVGACYSPPLLWPGDVQWGAFDTLDRCNATHLDRSFFGSTNGSCTERTDGFSLPLHTCVGPFGKPRPWGKFACPTVL